MSSSEVFNRVQLPLLLSWLPTQPRGVSLTFRSHRTLCCGPVPRPRQDRRMGSGTSVNLRAGALWECPCSLSAICSQITSVLWSKRRWDACVCVVVLGLRQPTSGGAFVCGAFSLVVTDLACMDTELMEASFLEVNGNRLAFVAPTGDASVVLIHGIPTHSYLWRHVTPALVAAGLPAIAVDLLGYGRSDKPVGVDLGIAAQARTLATALRLMNWRSGLIVGHDIGGGVAQLLAVAHPDLVRGLVLVDTIAYDSFPEPGIARLKEPVWDSILGAPDFDLSKGLTKGFMRGMVNSERVTPELIAAYERPFQGVEGRLAYLRAARALRTDELASQMEAVEHLEIPALIVWGSEDPFQPRRYGERLAKAMRNARFDLITGASHFLPEDAPELLAQRIVNFAKTHRNQ